MRGAGLVGACHRGSGQTTTRRDQDARPAPDLVDRKFTAERATALRCIPSNRRFVGSEALRSG